MKPRHCLALALLLAVTVPQAALAQDQAQASCPAKPKKKGFGLGGLLSAAKRAGVGDMIGGGMLGHGKAGSIMGAVTGTALNGAGGSEGSASPLAGLADGGRGAQIAGAVTGMAVEAARSAGNPSQCAAAG